MEKIKIYYRIEFKLESPLIIGCGENQTADNDLILDSRNMPYIPGSSLAGVYRSLFSKDTADRCFGSELTDKSVAESAQFGKNVLEDSKIIVYDANILPETGTNLKITIRDMVALDKHKVSIPGNKFDFQVLEPGVSFVTYMEQNTDDEREAYVLEEVAYAWMQGMIRLGAKTGRGYGQTRGVKVARRFFYITGESGRTDLSECEKRLFDQAQRGGRDEWLDFDMYDDACWQDSVNLQCLSRFEAIGNKDDGEIKICRELNAIYEEKSISFQKKRILRIHLELAQNGGLSVRQYSDQDVADYMQLKRGDDVAVIPGTSWAGAFRAQMEKLDPAFSRDALARLFFGKVKDSNGEGHKSRVTFSESELDSGVDKEARKKNWVTYTRNAIDRFSGGVIDKALYTEVIYFGKTTNLDITCDLTEVAIEVEEHFAKVLAAAVVDLHNGYMSVGGLTAVGRGLFRVNKVTVNGLSIDFTGLENERAYSKLLSALIKEEAK